MSSSQTAAAAKPAAFPFQLILFFAVITILFLTPPASSATFRCGSPPRSSCEFLLGFPTPPNATYTSLKALFGVKSIRRLFAANNLPTDTDPNRPVPTGSVLRVPLPCSCSNGSGTSLGRPEHAVRKGESLDAVARSVFGGFVDARQLAAANGIQDPGEVVDAGKKLKIPLPCSCDRVEGSDVVHYAHKVATGSTIQGVADEFGTTVDTLKVLNGIEDAGSIQAEQILDVPLRVCSSSVRNDSLDSPLLVPNNSYVLTAGNCVRCSCSSSTWQLQCSAIQTQGLKTKWPVCPPATCPNTTLDLGNSTSSAATAGPSSPLCNATLCAYAGYTKAGILTALTTTSVCPGEPQANGSSPSAESQGSSACSNRLGGSGRVVLMIRVVLLLAATVVYLGFV